MPRAISRRSTSEAELQPVASAEPLEDIELLLRDVLARAPSANGGNGRLSRPAIGHRGAHRRRCDRRRLARRFRAGHAADRIVLRLAIGLPVNLRGLDFDRLATTTEQHEGVPILVVGGDIVNDDQQERGRAASALRGAQCRATRNLFLDGRSAARRAAAGRSGLHSTPGSPRRRRTPMTCWCVSSTATT